MRPVIAAFTLLLCVNVAADQADLPDGWVQELEHIFLGCGVSQINHDVYPRKYWEHNERRPPDLSYNTKLCKTLAKYIRDALLSPDLKAKVGLDVYISIDRPTVKLATSIDLNLLEKRYHKDQHRLDYVDKLKAYNVSSRVLPLLIEPSKSKAWDARIAALDKMPDLPSPAAVRANLNELKVDQNKVIRDSMSPFFTRWMTVFIAGNMSERPGGPVKSRFGLSDDGTKHYVSVTLHEIKNDELRSLKLAGSYEQQDCSPSLSSAGSEKEIMNAIKRCISFAFASGKAISG